MLRPRKGNVAFLQRWQWFFRHRVGQHSDSVSENPRLGVGEFSDLCSPRNYFRRRILIDYIPMVTTVLAAIFTVILYRRWRVSPGAIYLAWWTFGVAAYGLGTLAESLNTVFGWQEWVFRSWYIAGALLGGFPLAQGTAYLLLKKKTAHRITAFFGVYITAAAIAVLATPIQYDLVTDRLTGAVMEWQWVRLWSPLVNTYAFFFLVGGAIWSAVRYWRRSDRPASRVGGNALIALGGILPGIGGSFARAGQIEVLYVTEFLGLILIWAGYRLIVKDTAGSVHENQLEVAAARSDVAPEGA